MSGKHNRNKIRKLKNKKLLAMLIALTLVFSCVIGGTVAWLITKTEPTINTFTYGDINITLTESDTGDNDGNPNTNTYNMIPGKTITKDPKVKVMAGSENSWLFVKLEKSIAPAAFDSFMEYEMAEGWIALGGAQGVFYREIAKSDAEQSFEVIKDNTVKVKDSVTKQMLNDLTEMPTLKITAYAVQRDGDIDAIDTAKEAWDLAQNS